MLTPNFLMKRLISRFLRGAKRVSASMPTSRLGPIKDGRIFQAKGQDYTLTELLGGDSKRAEDFMGGEFATIYLSPKDYHRVHMPQTGKLREMIYVPGDLFSVNQVTAENVPRLFARNERVVCIFDTDEGPLAMVLVGAMIVAAVETVWHGHITPPKRELRVEEYGVANDILLEKGSEMGRFKLGSTVKLTDCLAHTQGRARHQFRAPLRFPFRVTQNHGGP